VRRALRNKVHELVPLSLARERFERDYLVRLLRITDGNVAKAARLAHRNRSELYKLLRRHQLEPETFRDAH
jgi:two-component system response regulator GlrR